MSVNEDIVCHNITPDNYSAWSTSWSKDQKEVKLNFEEFKVPVKQLTVHPQHYAEFLTRLSTTGMTSYELDFYILAQRLMEYANTGHPPPNVNKLI